MKILILAVLYILFAPILGGLLTGLDRKVSARMQGRVGPSLFQPFFDVLKLIGKENITVRKSQSFYIIFYLLFIIFTGTLFYTGEDLLLTFFALTLADIFFVLGSFKSSSPYSNIGANRELMQMMAFEPMVLFYVMGVYMVTKTFYVSQILAAPKPLALYLIGIFVGFLYVLTIKLRKSPFDISMSHHAHQELISGVTTEFSGKTLAMIEVSHWYEKIFILGLIYLFFAFNPLIGVLVALGSYFLEVLIDNSYARVKWPLMVKSSWLVALLCGMGNIVVLSFIL